MHKTVDCYNSFLPDKNGSDQIRFAYEGTVSDKVKELEKQGLVKIDEAEKTVTYIGYDRSYALKRSVLQRNVMRILKYMAYGAPMRLAKRK